MSEAPDDEITPRGSIAATLVPLFLVQFFSWAGMFCVWIYAVPVISHDIFHGDSDPAEYGRALAAVGGCLSLIGLLAAILAFFYPKVVQRLGVRVTYAGALLIGAAGIAAVGALTHAIWLAVAFAAIGVGWGAMANLPYGIAGAAAPEGKGAHVLRLFGFSTFGPQAAVSIGLAFYGSNLSEDKVHYVMFGGAAMMAIGGLLALAFGSRFTLPAEEW